MNMTVSTKKHVSNETRLALVGAVPELFGSVERRQFDEHTLKFTHLLVVGDPPAQCNSGLSSLKNVCGSSEHVRNVRDADWWAWKVAGTENEILVFIHCERFCEIFDDLYLFRQRWPEIVVIVGTQDVKDNDFTKERGLVCDVTIKVPYSEFGLIIGVQAAFNNWLEMRDRRMYHWNMAEDYV